ncbi:unnamed protein product [Nesidiocoris tenuis]|uniref:Uncharacterized protein n=1 Tax=Nesidiocoris tenuis TaxID=355587 RepID=A0A6H5FW02_9HEMI|nr:unnamed protein product [Nesidiocoris tenuis]
MFAALSDTANRTLEETPHSSVMLEIVVARFWLVWSSLMHLQSSSALMNLPSRTKCAVTAIYESLFREVQQSVVMHNFETCESIFFNFSFISSYLEGIDVDEIFLREEAPVRGVRCRTGRSRGRRFRIVQSLGVQFTLNPANPWTIIMYSHRRLLFRPRAISVLRGIWGFEGISNGVKGKPLYQLYIKISIHLFNFNFGGNLRRLVSRFPHHSQARQSESPSIGYTRQVPTTEISSAIIFVPVRKNTPTGTPPVAFYRSGWYKFAREASSFFEGVTPGKVYITDDPDETQSSSLLDFSSKLRRFSDSAENFITAMPTRTRVCGQTLDAQQQQQENFENLVFYHIVTFTHPPRATYRSDTIVSWGAFIQLRALNFIIVPPESSDRRCRTNSQLQGDDFATKPWSIPGMLGQYTFTILLLVNEPKESRSMPICT